MPAPPQHPPPAPDWILGDDGHWRPPPFTAGPAPRPTPPASPPPGSRQTRRERMGLSRRDIVWGLVGLVTIAVGVYVRSDIRREMIDRALGREEPTAAEASDRAGSVEEKADVIQDDMGSTDLIILGPLGDAVCPEVHDVSTMTGKVMIDQILRQGFERSVNGVDVSGIECRYGDIRLGKLHGVEGRVADLLATEGPSVVTEGPFPGSARIDDPDTGRVTLVYEDTQAVMEAFITLPVEDATDLTFEALAGITLN